MSTPKPRKFGCHADPEGRVARVGNPTWGMRLFTEKNAILHSTGGSASSPQVGVPTWRTHKKSCLIHKPAGRAARARLAPQNIIDQITDIIPIIAIVTAQVATAKQIATRVIDVHARSKKEHRAR